jgi:hypothetical protein
MEMILLQQATGLASEELSSSALRSLSGMDRSVAARLAREMENDTTTTTTTTRSSLTRSSITSPHGGGASSVSPYRSSKLTSGASATASADAYGTASTETDDAAPTPLDQALINDAIQAHVDSGNALPAAEVVQVLSLAAQSEAGAKEARAMLKNLKNKTPEQVRALAVSLQLQEALRISNDVLNEKFDINAAVDALRKSELGLSPSSLVNRSTLKPQPTFPQTAAEKVLFAYNAGVGAGAGVGNSWVSAVSGEFDEIIQVLMPTEAAILGRYRVFRYVRDLVCSTLGVQLFPTGSLVSHTFLPDGDIDTSAFIAKTEDDSWFVRVNEVLCMSSFNSTGGYPGSKNNSFDTLPDMPDMIDFSSDDISISNVGFVNGDVKKIKITINYISVDISMNQIGALYGQYLIEAIDQFVGKNHLFKRCILLTEAWCKYESPRFTQGGGGMLNGGNNNIGGSGSVSSNGGGGSNGPAAAGTTTGVRFSPWTITVMLIWVFNVKGAEITCPLQALGHFLRIFAGFDWSRHALTVHGPVLASDLSADETLPAREGDLFFPEQMLKKFSYAEDDEAVTAAIAAAAAAAASAAAAAAASAAAAAAESAASEAASATEDASSAAVVAAAAAAEEETIMVGEMVVKIDKSANSSSSTSAGGAEASTEEASVSAAPSSLPTPTAATSTTTRGTGNSKNNSSSTENTNFFRGMVTELTSSYTQGLINIVDPAAPNNNLTVAVDIEGYQVVTSALYEGYKQFQVLCESFAKLENAAPASAAAATESAATFSESDMMKIMKVFLINTQLKVIGWNSSFKRKPGNLSRALETANEQLAPAAKSGLVSLNPNGDVLQSQFSELEVSFALMCLYSLVYFIGFSINYSYLSYLFPSLFF